MTDENNGTASRRIVLRRGLAVAAAALLTTEQAAAQAKVAQPMVQYQPTPKNGQECDACAQFVAPASCKIVDGVINPKGWCIAFAAKT